ncbi:MAG TPA: lysophospholipid acyltransferase family protein [Dehalococcoidia bacterium]|nr:lysophospholipid acyltransferase family protein [Dehalococcoidia bacterium]
MTAARPGLVVRVCAGIVNTVVRGLAFAFTRWRVEGREHVPREGSVILVANHITNLDPPILATATHRHVTYMAKQELFDLPVIGFVFRLYGAFSVRRFEADLAALRQAQNVLKGGQVLGMFPEGTRSRGSGLGAPYPGAALIALRSNALIVPAAITGTERLMGLGLILFPFTRPRITVRFGEPFRLPQTARPRPDDIKRGSMQIMRSIAELLPEPYLGPHGRALLAGEDIPLAAGPPAHYLEKTAGQR